MKNIIIILNYNDSKNCINLYNQIKNYKCINNIIFVDNNSNDDSLEILNNIKDNHVDIVKVSVNKGYAYGNNEGIKYAIKKYKKSNIIISNPDIEIKEKDLNGLLNLINSNKNISVLAPTIIENNTLNRGWKLPNGIDEVKLSIPIIGKNRNKIIGYKDDYYKGDISKVDVVSGSFFIIKSDVIKDVNYFDENTFLYYEENILSKKLKDYNYNVYVSNVFKAKHNHSQTVNKNINNLKKFKILKESQKYYINNYTKTNILEKILIYFFSNVTKIYIIIKKEMR